MFDKGQVRALTGPFKDIQRLVPKPHLRCLGCVLKVVVLVEGEPSPPVWDPALRSRFSSRISLYFSPYIFASILTSLLVPAAEKHPRSMMLPPPWDGARFPPDVMLGTLWRVLMVPNLLHLRIMEFTVFLGTFNAAEMFSNQIKFHLTVKCLLTSP